VLKRGTFTEPESCTQAKQEWRIEADQVAQFVGEMCKLEQDAEITSSLLYGAYKHWADDAGIFGRGDATFMKIAPSHPKV